MKKGLLLIFYILILSAFWEIEWCSADPDARERLRQAESYIAEGEIDFAFMEYQALLREFPEDPSSLQAAFAVGEYHFKQRNTREARRVFETFEEESTEEIPKLLALVYRLQCAHLSEDTTSIQTLESHLKEFLSSRRIFLAFEENQTQKWTSPLGNRFELHEFVDRMEILLNGEPFYTIRLP